MHVRLCLSSLTLALHKRRNILFELADIYTLLLLRGSEFAFFAGQVPHCALAE
jgi:hypothetical protein